MTQALLRWRMAPSEQVVLYYYEPVQINSI